MKGNSILLVDADGDCEELVRSVATGIGRCVRCVRTSREAFAILSEQLRKVEIMIVDVDPGAHGIALLEALSGCPERPPMMVLTALEETYMQPIAKNHGATVCLDKPISAARLRTAFAKLERREHMMSDTWGHPTVPKATHTSEVKFAIRGISQKLSPHASKRRRMRRVARNSDSCWPLATLRKEMTEL
jgi:DNA-binding response OmpR family regulator